MTTYDKVKQIAEAQGKKIANVEVDAGIANGTISGWRTGKPYAETLKKVADTLGVGIDELLPSDP